MFKAIISAALCLSPLAFAEEPTPGSMEPAMPTKDAAPADKPAKGHHHGHKGHHGHKADAPSTEAPSK